MGPAERAIHPSIQCSINPVLIWSPRLVSRQRLLLFREALICLSYLGMCGKLQAPNSKFQRSSKTPSCKGEMEMCRVRSSSFRNGTEPNNKRLRATAPCAFAEEWSFQAQVALSHYSGLEPLRGGRMAQYREMVSAFRCTDLMWFSLNSGKAVAPNSQRNRGFCLVREDHVSHLRLWVFSVHQRAGIPRRGACKDGTRGSSERPGGIG